MEKGTLSTLSAVSSPAGLWCDPPKVTTGQCTLQRVPDLCGLPSSLLCSFFTCEIYGVI